MSKSIYHQQLENAGITVTNITNAKGKIYFKRGKEELGFLSMKEAHKQYVLRMTDFSNLKVGDNVVTLEYGEGTIRNVFPDKLKVYFYQEMTKIEILKSQVTEAFKGIKGLV